jgi:hypothetical protein
MKRQKQNSKMAENKCFRPKNYYSKNPPKNATKLPKNIQKTPQKFKTTKNLPKRHENSKLPKNKKKTQNQKLNKND